MCYDTFHRVHNSKINRHDISNSGVTVGAGDNAVCVYNLEYADDPALIDENVEQASARLTSIANGSLEEAAMVISIRKCTVMHIHKKTRVSATTEADVASLNLSHKCSACAREFTKQRGLIIHMARWCDGGRTQRSRVGTLTDKAVKTAKRRAAEATLGTVEIDNNVLGNVYSFEYLGSRLQGDGDDEADVRYRMDIAQAAFASLSHLWTDHRLSRNLKLRLYNLCVCSTLTHSCEKGNLTKTVSRILNGFNSRRLHIITGEEYHVTAVSPANNLLLSVRQRRLHYLGHLLRLPHDSVVRRTLIAMADGGNRYPVPDQGCAGPVAYYYPRGPFAADLQHLPLQRVQENQWGKKIN